MEHVVSHYLYNESLISGPRFVLVPAFTLWWEIFFLWVETFKPLEMDPSSIVSFRNDSTLKPEYSASDGREVNVHELALHAMRDRCLLLQRRISALENDNMRLKLLSGDSEPYRQLDSDERHLLSAQLADLTKQKSQLMHHVFMVTCENKNLWRRLASLKKATRSELSTSNYQALENTPKITLLRTNTYIQTSTPQVDANQEKYSDTSLEEISLKLINSYIQERSQLVEQYEQMAELQSSKDVLNMDSIGFAYLEEPTTDSLKEITAQTEKLSQLKKEVTKQEADLMTILNHLEKLAQSNRKCTSCISKGNTQVPTENKEIETSDSLGEWATPAHSNSYHEENISGMNTISQTVSDDQKDPVVLSDYQTELPTDQDKMCPMCGRVFKKGSTFAEFQHHVEHHFIGDPEPDSVDYEITSSSINNFN